MKALTLLLFCLLANTIQAQQPEARLHQILHTISDKVHIQVSNEQYQVNVKETYANVIIVEVIVGIENASIQQTEELIKTGRYHVSHEEKNGVIHIQTKKELAPVIINSKQAEEYVIYNISVPEYMEWTLDRSPISDK